MKQIIEKIKEVLNQNFNDYNNQIPSYEFISSSLLGKKSIEVKFGKFMGFNTDVLKKYTSSLSYYSGNILDNAKVIDPKNYLNKIFENPSNENFNTFISMELFNDLFKKILLAPEIIMNLKDNTIEGSLTFAFTVKTLKEVFANIPTSYSDEDNFEIFSTLKKVEFNGNFNASVSMEHSIKIKDKIDVIKFTTDNSFTLEIKKIKLISFDLCISGVSDNVEIKMVEPSSITISDENKLVERFKEVIIQGFNKICLTDNGINLRDYYKIINSVEIGQNGIYIEGKRLYEY